MKNHPVLVAWLIVAGVMLGMVAVSQLIVMAHDLLDYLVDDDLL